MHDHEYGLSPTHEMYLKVLYRLQQDQQVGRVRDMSKGLGVTPSTVSAVLKKLERAGLVLHDHYGMVQLTPAGHRVALCVVRRYEVIKTFLIEVLGLDTEAAEVDACMMEHAIGPATVNRMESFFNSVRTGEVVVPGPSDVSLSAPGCSECEVAGTCQAVAAVVPQEGGRR